MSTHTEGAPEGVHYDLFEATLNSRPPLPVGRPELPFEKFAHADNPNQAGYAWLGFPRWLKDAGTGAVNIDIGSCVPDYAQMNRAAKFNNYYIMAKELVVRLHANGERENNVSWGDSFAALRHAANDNKVMRQLLHSGTAAALYQLLPSELEGETEAVQARLAERFYVHLSGQTDAYDRQRFVKDEEEGMEARWSTGFDVNPTGRTYLQHLAVARVQSPIAKLASARLRAVEKGTKPDPVDLDLVRRKAPAGKQLAEEFIRAQATDLARMAVGDERLEAARFISFDIADPAEIAASSMIATPAAIQATNIRAHAINSLFDPTQHYQGNMFEPLPVPDNSIDVITDIDGFWPYSSFEGMGDREVDTCIVVAATAIYGFYQKLTYETGTYISFPWDTADPDRQRSRNILDTVKRRLSCLLGHAATTKSFDMIVIEEMMSDSDREIMARSGAFVAGALEREALILTKASESLVKQHLVTQPHRMAKFDAINWREVLGWPNPRQ